MGNESRGYRVKGGKEVKKEGGKRIEKEMRVKAESTISIVTYSFTHPILLP